MDTQHPPLNESDISAIQAEIACAYLALRGGDVLAAYRALARVAHEWGPEGEYVVALGSAKEIHLQAPPAHRDAQGRPLLERVISLDAPHLTAFTHFLACMDPELTDYNLTEASATLTDYTGWVELSHHTLTELSGALAQNTRWVQSYVHHIHDGAFHEAYDVWCHMYAVTDPDIPTSQDDAWRAVACSALLLWWAAAYCVVPITS